MVLLCMVSCVVMINNGHIGHRCLRNLKRKANENPNNPNCIAAGIGHSVCVNHLWPVAAGGGGDMIYRTFEQWKSGNVLEHGVPRTEHYSEDQLDLVEMGWMYGYDAGRAVEQALDKKAENARELGLDYEPVLKDNSNYRLDPPVAEPVAWMYPDDYERMLTSETFCTVYSVEVGSATRGESTVALYTTPPAAAIRARSNT
jgi:hypothetical protein